MKIILDESLLRREQLDALDDPSRWIINLRVSKMGGLVRTLAAAATAQERGIGVIIGCQVGETSILTRAGLAAMHAVGKRLTASEGAFGTHLLRRDLTTPSVMFGAGGVLDPDHVPLARSDGLGLAIRERLLVSLDVGTGRPSVAATKTDW